jgi:hypothetical protein
MLDCFSSFNKLFGTDCQSTVTVLIFVVSIAGSAFYYLVKLIWKNYFSKYNFVVQFVDHPPPNRTDHNFHFPYSLPIGKFKLCCFVKAVHRFHPARLNFRFLNSDGTNVPQSIVNIVKIEEGDCDPSILESMIPDTEGGMDCSCKNNVPALAAGEAHYFWITANAAKPWVGNLSIRVQDPSGFRAYGRHEVTISEVPGSPLLST